MAEFTANTLLKAELQKPVSTFNFNKDKQKPTEFHTDLCTWCGGTLWGSDERSFGICPGFASPSAPCREHQRTIVSSSQVS